MNILIDINHPAHVHYFRNFFKIMVEKGHKILVVSRNKEMEHHLLTAYQIPFVDRGKGRNGKAGKLFYMIYANHKIYRLARKFKPDVFLNFLHPYPSQVAKLMGKPSLVFSDTEHATLHHKLTVPFATRIYTPSCYSMDLGKKHHRFSGYMELAYLHPNYYEPKKDILDILGVEEGERYAVVRFVSWGAAHDFGHVGISLENKQKTIEEISQYVKVFISAEGKLPSNLEPYRIKIPLERMHDVIFYSSILFGESGTMTSEAAILGTPAIFMNNSRLGYTCEEEDKYGLVFNFTESEADQQLAIEKAVEILRDPNFDLVYKLKRKRLLEENIDTTAFMIREVENLINS